MEAQSGRHPSTGLGGKPFSFNCLLAKPQQVGGSWGVASEQTGQPGGGVGLEGIFGTMALAGPGEAAGLDGCFCILKSF